MQQHNEASSQLVPPCLFDIQTHHLEIYGQSLRFPLTGKAMQFNWLHISAVSNLPPPYYKRTDCAKNHHTALFCSSFTISYS